MLVRLHVPPEVIGDTTTHLKWNHGEIGGKGSAQEIRTREHNEEFTILTLAPKASDIPQNTTSRQVMERETPDNKHRIVSSTSGGIPAMITIQSDNEVVSWCQAEPSPPQHFSRAQRPELTHRCGGW